MPEVMPEFMPKLMPTFLPKCLVVPFPKVQFGPTFLKGCFLKIMYDDS